MKTIITWSAVTIVIVYLATSFSLVSFPCDNQLKSYVGKTCSVVDEVIAPGITFSGEIIDQKPQKGILFFSELGLINDLRNGSMNTLTPKDNLALSRMAEFIHQQIPNYFSEIRTSIGFDQDVRKMTWRFMSFQGEFLNLKPNGQGRFTAGYISPNVEESEEGIWTNGRLTTRCNIDDFGWDYLNDDLELPDCE